MAAAEIVTFRAGLHFDPAAISLRGLITTGRSALFLAVAGVTLAGCGVGDPVDSSSTSTQLIELTPTSLSFAVEEGHDPAPQTFTVTNAGGGTLDCEATDDAEWMSLGAISGPLGAGASDQVTVSVSVVGLVAGTYSGTITVTGNAENSPQTVAVELTVTAAPLIELEPTTLSFAVTAGRDPAPQVVTVLNAGAGTLDWQATVDRAWLSLAPASGSLGKEASELVTVSVSSSGLGAGTYSGTISVTGNAENSPRTVAVDLTIRAEPVDTLRGVPLIDMGDSITYKGFAGWLYAGSNDPPATHVARQPAIATAAPFGFASLGMSNTWWEWCKSPWDEGTVGPHGCTDYSFTGAVADSVATHPNLRLVSGAQGGKVAKEWASGFNSAWTVLNERLAMHGLEPQDLKVVWVKVVNRNPEVALPSAGADAYELLERLGDIVRLLRERYGVQQVYLSSRIWAPPCAGPKNPEPYAYETGYAVKWLVEAQIEQLEGGPVDAVAGDLSLEAAPWLAWGPYLWADNGNERSDGLTWSPDDMLDPCHEHPGVPGIKKVANLLVAFFRDSELTPWFWP